MLTACSDTPAPAATEATPTASAPAPTVAPPPVPPPPAPPPDYTGTPCVVLAAIENPPSLVGPPTTDPAYEAIKRSGADALPCLVDAIADDRPLDHSQSIPGHEAAFATGDLAFFLLIDFGFVDFAQALPPDVSQATLTRGPFAFFDWIVQPGNRPRLQARVRDQLEASGKMPEVVATSVRTP